MLSSFKKILIKQLGGFTDIDEAIDSISDSKERRHLLTRAVKVLYNTIGADDILKVNENGQWMFQGKPINDGEKKLLIAEATQMLGMNTFKILEADIKYQANRKMFLLAENEEHLVAGKLWLLTLDAFKQRLENMKSEIGSFNKK